MLRVGCTFDLACNPFPLFFDLSNHAHRRTRGNRNPAVSFGLFLAAVGWNVLHLAGTLRIRREERRRVAAYRRAAGAPNLR